MQSKLDRKKHVEELIDGAQVLRRRASGASDIQRPDITGSQWMVIGYIFRNEGCSTNDAAASLNMTGSAVTQLVNGLVAKGYVRREQNPSDKRAHSLIVTDDSKKKMAAYKAKRVEMMLKMFEALSDSEFSKYVSLNKKILDSMRVTA